MKQVLNHLTSAVCAMAVLTGLVLSWPESPEVASSSAWGGQPNNLDLTYVNCPASKKCTANLCDQATQKCAAGTKGIVQQTPSIPNGSKAGSSYHSTRAKTYLCAKGWQCSNPCLQGVDDNKWYCNAEVGDPFDGNANGVEGVVGSPET